MSALEEAWIAFGGESFPPHHGWSKVPCVLHMDSKPSATVHGDAGKWSCFAGCGHGDVYDLIGLHELLPEFSDQKAYADERGWIPEGDATPEPTVMNPRPKQNKGKAKKPWKPSWL